MVGIHPYEADVIAQTSIARLLVEENSRTPYSRNCCIEGRYEQAQINMARDKSPVPRLLDHTRDECKSTA